MKRRNKKLKMKKLKKKKTAMTKYQIQENFGKIKIKKMILKFQMTITSKIKKLIKKMMLEN